MSPKVQKVVKWYESLSFHTLSSIEDVYAGDVFFNDSFHDYRDSSEELFGKIPMVCSVFNLTRKVF